MAEQDTNGFSLEKVKKDRKGENRAGRKKLRRMTNYSMEMEPIMESLPDKLTKAPWLIVSEHFENVFVNAGYEVFKYLSLQVISPYAPKLVIAGNEERPSLNVMILANPGSGKTAMIKKAKKIAPYDYGEMVQKQSQVSLQDLVTENPQGINLFVNDMKTILNDDSLMKTYETVIADGFVSRDVSGSQQKSDDVRAAMVGGAVPDDINNKVYGGLIFRVVPLQIKYTSGQQKEVMDHITSSMSEENKSGLDTEEISIFYDTLYTAIRGEFDDVPKITGYDVDEQYAKRVQAAIEEAMDTLHLGQFERVAFYRQLQDGLRMMALHALLNLHNREIVNVEENDEGKLEGEVKVTQQDAEIASALVKQLMGTLNGFLGDDQIQEQFAELDKFDSGQEFGTEGVENKHFDMEV